MVMNFQKLQETARKAFSQFLKVSVIILALIAGFVGHGIYIRYKEGAPREQAMQPTRNETATSVAINERNEVIIINRETGEYQVFSQPVGQMIFDLYSKQYYTVK